MKDGSRQVSRVDPSASDRTNAFSKKLENFKAAVALHFGYYNFVRVHQTLRMTPAMAGGVTNHIWTVPELMEAAA